MCEDPSELADEPFNVAEHYPYRYCFDMTYRNELREIAMGNHGFVTTRQAVAAGVPSAELPKLAQHAGLESVSYGLYRFTDLPAEENDQAAEAVLRAGHGAYLYGESVLALHGGLADVNPDRVLVAVHRRVRRDLPSFMSIVQGSPDDVITVYDGIPSQDVAGALLASRNRIGDQRLRSAADRARAEGLLTAREFARLRERLTE